MQEISNEKLDQMFSHYAPEAQAWPWDLVPKIEKRLEPKYETLKPGNWVEDELIEKAITTLIQQNELIDQCGFLESYVMKYGTRLDDHDGVLCRIVEEKALLQKKAVLALVNTDFEGHGGHWVLGVMDMVNRKILLIDSSLVLSKTYYRKTFFVLLNILHVAFSVEGEVFYPNDWRLRVCLDTVQQENAYDCGPLTVCNAYAIMQNQFLDKPPKSTVKIREWILYTLKSTSNTQVEIVGAGNGKAEEAKEREIIKQFEATGLKIRFTFFFDSNILK